MSGIGNLSPMVYRLSSCNQYIISTSDLLFFFFFNLNHRGWVGLQHGWIIPVASISLRSCSTTVFCTVGKLYGLMFTNWLPFFNGILQSWDLGGGSSLGSVSTFHISCIPLGLFSSSLPSKLQSCSIVNYPSYAGVLRGLLQKSIEDLTILHL